MKKNILVILGHPDYDTFNGELFDAYVRGAKEAGANVRFVKLGEIKFNSNLAFGYKKRTNLEPDLLKAQKDIKWADHVVFVYPTWWGTVPAIMKGFIDRVFLPKFAFSYSEGDKFPKGLLAGRSARIIFTMDGPGIFYKLFTRAPGLNMMKRSVLGFCGFKPVKHTLIGSVRGLSEIEKEKWLLKVEKLGIKLE